MLGKIKDTLSPSAKSRLLNCFYGPFKLRDVCFAIYHGFSSVQGWRLHGLPQIHMRDRGSIKIGKNFSAVSQWRKNSIGVTQPVILKTLRKNAKILIGNNVGISGSTISANQLVEIGNDVLIGSGVLITDCDAHPVSYRNRLGGLKPKMAPVFIEDGVFIGARSIILKGVRIGRGSVIGAGSVVVKDVLPGVIAAGNPAQLIKTIEE